MGSLYNKQILNRMPKMRSETWWQRKRYQFEVTGENYWKFSYAFNLNSNIDIEQGSNCWLGYQETLAC